MVISNLFDSLMILFGAGAALYWYRSSSVKLIERIDGGNAEGIADSPDLMDSLKLQGHYNKIAAAYACFGAATQALSSIAKLF